MNQREKILAASIGVLLGLVLLQTVFQRVNTWFTERDNRIALLNREIEQKERQVRLGLRAARRFQLYQQRSLPQDPLVAGSLYRGWLLGLVGEVNLAEPQVRIVSVAPHADLYQHFTFVVLGRGDLKQLTEFLYKFYRGHGIHPVGDAGDGEDQQHAPVDQLHRVKWLSAEPLKDSRQLKLNLTIEALALGSSSHVDRLGGAEADRLAGRDLSEYVDSIVRRNVFSPPNKPPSLKVDARPSYFADETVVFSAGGTDPESHPIRYRLEQHELEGARIDEGGRFSWRPQAPGEYSVTVVAEDGGFPPRTTETLVRFAVRERPPAAPEEPASFDVARFTFLTGITEADGEARAWLDVRPTGRRLHLGEGDRLDVGSISGVIRRIAAKQMEFEAGGKRMVVSLGENLAEAREAPVGG